MSQPLKGIKVVEVSMWGYVPSAGAVLSDWGADIIKIEPPTGDPMRTLNYAGITPEECGGSSYMSDIFNRGKRNVAMDLSVDGALDLLYKMIDDADVFLTSLLPPTRRKLKIDTEDVKARNPNIIYAVGSGYGPNGPDGEKGGFDGISYWARGGVSSAATPDDLPYPLAMPGGAFGDGISGYVLAGGIAAAIAQRERTGEATVVDGALLATAMWMMQPGIVGSKIKGVDELPKMANRFMNPNPLVNNYRTSDGRFVSLCMLQSQRYWAGFCKAAGRDDLAEHPDFATDEARAANLEACIKTLDELFATRTLAEWREILGSQAGQWDVVQKARELVDDVQSVANGFTQEVKYADGHTLTMVSTPVQFGRTPSVAKPAPDLGEHTDEVMMELGLDMDQIIEAKIAGILL